MPAPRITLVSALALFLIFFIGALGEELGWSGYALDPMQQRWGALAASVILGLVWATWHIAGLAQTQRSLEWIAWWSLVPLLSCRARSLQGEREQGRQARADETARRL